MATQNIVDVTTKINMEVNDSELKSANNNFHKLIEQFTQIAKMDLGLDQFDYLKTTRTEMDELIKKSKELEKSNNDARKALMKQAKQAGGEVGYSPQANALLDQNTRLRSLETLRKEIASIPTDIDLNKQLNQVNELNNKVKILVEELLGIENFDFLESSVRKSGQILEVLEQVEDMLNYTSQRMNKTSNSGAKEELKEQFKLLKSIKPLMDEVSKLQENINKTSGNLSTVRNITDNTAKEYADAVKANQERQKLNRSDYHKQMRKLPKEIKELPNVTNKDKDYQSVKTQLVASARKALSEKYRESFKDSYSGDALLSKANTTASRDISDKLETWIAARENNGTEVSIAHIKEYIFSLLNDLSKKQNLVNTNKVSLGDSSLELSPIPTVNLENGGYIPSYYKKTQYIKEIGSKGQEVERPYETYLPQTSVKLSGLKSLTAMGDLVGKDQNNRGLFGINQELEKIKAGQVGASAEDVAKSEQVINNVINEISNLAKIASGKIEEYSSNIDNLTDAQQHELEVYQKFISQLSSSYHEGGILYDRVRQQAGLKSQTPTDFEYFGSDTALPHNDANTGMGQLNTMGTEAREQKAFKDERKEEAKVKTAFTGKDVVQYGKDFAALMASLYSDEFRQGFEEALKNGKGAEYIGNIRANILASLDKDLDSNHDPREISVGLGYGEGAYGAGGIYTDKSGRARIALEDRDNPENIYAEEMSLREQVDEDLVEEDEAIKREISDLSDSQKAIVILNDALERLKGSLDGYTDEIDRIKGKNDSVLSSIVGIRDNSPKDIPQAINMSANGLSNYVTEGQVIYRATEQYAADSGISFDDAWNQNIAEYDDEMHVKIENSFKLRQAIDNMLSTTISEFKNKIASIKKPVDSDMTGLIADAQELDDGNFINVYSLFLEQRNRYADEMAQWDKAASSHKKKPFNKQQYNIRKQFVESVDSSFEALTSGFSESVGTINDKELNGILQNLEYFKKDAASFAEFLKKFYGETYIVGGRSFNTAVTEEHDQQYKEPRYYGNPSGGDRTPKERFFDNRGYNYLANYGASTLEEALPRAYQRLEEKTSLLTDENIQEEKQRATDILTKYSEEKAVLESFIKEMEEKYSAFLKETKSGKNISWNSAFETVKSDADEDITSLRDAKRIIKITQQKYKDALTKDGSVDWNKVNNDTAYLATIPYDTLKDDKYLYEKAVARVNSYNPAHEKELRDQRNQMGQDRRAYIDAKRDLSALNKSKEVQEAQDILSELGQSEQSLTTEIANIKRQIEYMEQLAEVRKQRVTTQEEIAQTEKDEQEHIKVENENIKTESEKIVEANKEQAQVITQATEEVKQAEQKLQENIVEASSQVSDNALPSTTEITEATVVTENADANLQNNEAIIQGNNVLEQHVTDVNNAIEAEQNKLTISEQLTKQLKAELEALEALNKGFAEHGDVVNNATTAESNKKKSSKQKAEQYQNESELPFGLSDNYDENQKQAQQELNEQMRNEAIAEMRRPDYQTKLDRGTASQIGDILEQDPAYQRDVLNERDAFSQYQKYLQEQIKLVEQSEKIQALKIQNQQRINELSGLTNKSAQEEIEKLQQQNNLYDQQLADINKLYDAASLSKKYTGLLDAVKGQGADGKILNSFSAARLKQINETGERNAEEAIISGRISAQQQIQENSLKQQNSLVSSYLSNYEKMAQLLVNIINLQEKGEILEGNALAENQAQLEKAQQQYDAEERNLEVFNEEALTLNNMTLTAENLARIRERTAQIDAESQATIAINSAKNTTLADKTQGKEAKNNINQYLSAFRRNNAIEQQIARTNKAMEGQTGSALANSKQIVTALQEQQIALNNIINGYDREHGILNGIQLTDEQRVSLNRDIDSLQASQAAKINTINGLQAKQVGFLDKLASGFKQQLTYLIDMSLAYQAVGKVRQIIQQIITQTQELDSSIVDIQIATGMTREETRALLLDYTAMADKLGRSTKDIANAANDWLRAGYEGAEAAKLTEASMVLSTLGMIESSEATTYLISTLKGWKLSAEEVIGVVDRLSAVDMSAAISAGDLALAMSRANNSARLAGADMNKFIGYVTTVADVTQKSAESVGESFKTIFSRFGNVKAGKFVASQEEMNLPDYDEAEFENLNDIETVLDSIGIKIRDNYSTWRDIDDILAEIGKKWNTWDTTTQNAIATAVAGTRQRENVLTLFSNWEDVSKYAEIAENAYGTATKKMEAYSDSIDAAKNRLSAALEKIILDLNNFEVIKDFYNVMTFIVTNLKTLIPILTGYIAITRADSLAQSFGGVAEKIASRFMNLGLSGSTAQSNGQAAVGIFGNMRKNIGENLTQGYLMAQEQAYAQSLSRYTMSLNDREAQSVRTLQSEILSMEATDKKIIAEQLLANTYNEEALASLTEDQQRRIATILYTQVVDQNTANILRQIALGGNLTEAQLAEIDARGGVTRLLYEEMNNITKNNNIRKQMSNNLQSSLNTNKSSVLSATLAGVGSLGGGLLGGRIGNNIANAYGLSGTGQVALMTGGSLLGSFGLKALGAGAGTLLGGGTASAASSAALAAVGMTNPAGWFAIGAAIVGLVIAGIKSAAKKKEQEIANAAQEAFLEASETYNNDKNMLASVKKYDELAKGVNEFGENISLTEEDYSTFIELTNKLAEQFPDLITYTDEAENKFIGLGGSIGGVTEAVEALIKAEQKDADQKLLKSELLKNQQDEYNKESSSYIQQLNALRTLKDNKDIINNVTTNNAVLDFGLGNLDEDTRKRYRQAEKALKQSGIKYEYNNPQFSANFTYKFDEAQIDAAIEKTEKALFEIQGQYIDTYMAMLRQNKGKDETGAIIDTASILEGMSNNEISILTQAIKGAGLDFSSETIANDVAEIALHTSEILGKMPEEATEIARKKQEDYATIGAYDDAQRKLANLVAKELTVGSDGLFNSVDRSLITNTYGLRIRKDGNDDEGYHEYIAPNDNLFQQLLRETNYGYGVSGYRDYMKNLSFSDAKILKDLNDSGILQYLDNTDDWTRLILNERGYGDDIYSKRSYYNDQREQNKAFKEAFANDMNGYIDSSKPTVLGNLSDNDINKMYGKYGLQIAKAIKNSRDEIEKAIKDGVNGEELQELYNSEIEKIFASSDLLESNANIEVIKQTLADTFADVDLGTEGLISSFAELKEVLDSVYESLDRLKSAQEEQAATGQLSVETVLSLLAADESYLSVLQAENGVITLVNGAEEIMAANKLAAAQAGMAEMRASMLKEAAQIQETLTTNELTESTDAEVQSSINAINASDTLSTAMIKETKAALEAAKGHIELNNARNGNGNMAAIEKLEANVESIVNSVGAVATDVSKISTTSRKLNESDIESLKHRWEQLTGVSAEDAFSTTYIYEDSSGRTITSDKPIDINRYTLVDQKTIINDGYNLIGNDGKNFKWGTQGYIPTLDNLMNSTTLTNPTNFWSDYKHDSSNKGSSGKETTPDEILKAIESAINKEYEAMIAWDKTLLTGVEHETEYFTKMRGVLEREKEYYASLIESGTLTEKERLETEQKLIEAEVKLRNLDDEEIKDKIKILELQNADKKVIVEQYRTLVKTADTLEECLEYQKQLYEAMRDEVNTRLQIAEAQEKSAKDTLQYYEELEQLSAQRLVTAKDAYEYMTDPNASGNSWLDAQKEILEANTTKWWEYQKQIESGSLSDEDIAKLRGLQKELHDNSEEVREGMGYNSSANGTGFNDNTNGEAGTEKNRLENEQDKKAVREQNRTIIENTIKMYENQNVANRLIDEQLQKLYLLAQNDDQKIDILKRISDNLKQQYQVQKSMHDLFKNIDEWELDYLNPYLNTERYNWVTDDIKSQLQSIQDSAYEEYARLWNEVYNDNIAAGATPEEAATQAYADSDVQGAFNDFVEAYQAYGDLIVRIVEDKLNHIQWHIEKLNKEKPDVWGSYDLIGEFANQEISLNQKKLDELKEALKDTSHLTDEQIKNLVDEYNDAYKEIHAIKVRELEDQIEYQDRIYNAAVNEINRYIDDLEKQKDAAVDAYDKELEKLKDKEDAIARTNKLIQLQNNLLNSQKEKERVFRQGVGWVYETPRDKIKKAQKDLDDFNLQDNIDDLEAAKNKELELLDEAIKGWQLYLEMLAYQYGEYDRLQEQQLLREYFGVKSNEEVQKIITDDMVTFNKNYKNNMENFITDLDILFGKFVSVFETLLEKITGLQFNLLEEQTKVFDLLDINDYLIGNEVQDLADYFRNPPKQQAKLIKKLEADPIYDIILNDAAIEKNSQAAGNKASKYWTTVTNADGEKISRLDLSGLMAEDIKNGNWVAALEHSILRTSAVLTEGHDLNALGWRSNKEVFIDAMKDAGYYQAVIDAFDKIYNEDKVWENANLMNVFSQLEQGNGVASELNQGLITVMAMLGTGNELSEEQIAQIGEAIAGLNMLSGEYDSTSDIYNQYISSRLAALNADTNETGSFYDALMNLNGIGNNQEMKDYMNLIDAEYQATGGKGSLFMNEHIDYSALLNQALDNNDYLTALRAGIVRDKKIEEKNIDLRANGWDTTKDTLLNALSKNGLSEAQLKTVNQNLNDIDTTYKNASAINNYLQSTGNNYLSQNAGLLSGLALTLPNEIGYDFAQMIGTSISNADLLSNGISYSTNEAGQIIISNASENADAVNATLGELQNSFTSDIQDQISKDATYYDQVIELLKASNATKDEIRAFNNSYVSSGGTFTGSSYGDSGYDGSDSSSSRTWTSTYTRVDSSGNTNTATGSYNGSISASDAIAQAKSDWAAANARNDPQGMAQAHANAEAARASMGYSTDDSGLNPTPLGSHALGIETGPVTYTGLGMLHGTPSSPEYVLNSDQAYNILRYISTNKPQDNIETNNNNNTSTTQYVVEGDIVLEGVNDPAEFWNSVTTAMGTRWNVTKNNRIK